MTKKSKIAFLVIISLIVLNVQAQIQKPQNELSVEGYPEITFKERTHDFGTINEGEVVETLFEFTNTGTVPLLISKINASCGCTVPSGWSKQPIQAGESSAFSVKFDSKNKPHQQSKTVRVYSNTKKGVDYVKIKLIVTPDPSLEAIRVERTKKRKEQYRMQKEKAALKDKATPVQLSDKKNEVAQKNNLNEKITLDNDRKKALEATKDLKIEREKAEKEVKILKKENEKLADQTKKLEKETKKAEKERKKTLKLAKKEMKEAKKKAKKSAKIEKASNAVIDRQDKISKLEAKLKKIETKGDLSPNEKLEFEEKIAKLNSKLEKEKKVLSKLQTK